ncbi:MAG TPA: sigma-70 family RNA polymerase sigma factor [Ktedonobacterales bacterium]|nr:sigma-70 family RNA polymerase sigma factor [Ktedonobacterales bacterium]
MDTALSLPFPLSSPTELARPACPADEAEWARAAAGGDKGAFARLVEKHKQSVYGLCYRLLGTGEESRDASQEAFVRAYTGIRDFDARQPFAAWVLRIARNHCIDLLRRRRPTLALQAESRSDEGPETGVAPELSDHYAMGGEQAVQELEAQRDLERAVAALPPRYREVIALFHVQHHSYAEIADALGVPMGTVMTWLHRARKELRERLSEHLS